MRYWHIILFYFFIKTSAAQWRPTSGPWISSQYISLDISKLAVSGDLLYGVIQNSVYISMDNGKSWMYASNGAGHVDNFEVSDSLIFTTGQQGIRISKNWGSSYIQISGVGLPNNYKVRKIKFTGKLLIAAIINNATYIDDIYYSQDSGSTWQKSNGVNNNYIRCFAFNSSKIYAVTSYGNVYMSNDSAKNWNLIGSFFNLSSTDFVYADENRIFVGESNSGGGLFVSSDQGDSWTKITNGLAPYIVSISSNSNFVFAATSYNGVYRSNNNGTSWSATGGTPCNDIEIDAMAIKGNNIYCGTNGGFAASANQGSTWSCDLFKTYNLNIKSVAVNNSFLVAAASYGTYSSANSGNDYLMYLRNLEAISIVDSIVLAGGKGSYMRSTNGGVSWQSIYFPGKMLDVIFKDSIAYASTLDSGIYVSDNYGLNWKPMNNGLLNKKMNKLASSDSLLVAGSMNKGIYIWNKSTKEWFQSNSGLLDTTIQCVAAFNDIIFLGTKSNGIYKSINKGLTWELSYVDSADTNITCLYMYGTNVFAGILGRGFYMSTDTGKTWKTLNSGLINYNISDICENDSFIYVASKGPYDYGSGIWKKSLKEISLALSIKKLYAGNLSVCIGDSTMLSALVIGGSRPYTFSWDNGSTDSNIYVKPIVNTKYYLTVTDSNLNNIKVSIEIAMKKKPDAPIIYQNGWYLYSTVDTGNVWIKNGVLLLDSINNNICIDEQHGVFTTLVYKDGCPSDTSNKIDVKISEDVIKNVIEINPNPSFNVLHVKAPINSLVEILSADGSVLKTKSMDSNYIKVEISEYPAGLYIIKIKSQEITFSRKLLKL